jgi:hypothetical protein
MHPRARRLITAIGGIAAVSLAATACTSTSTPLIDASATSNPTATAGRASSSGDDGTTGLSTIPSVVEISNRLAAAGITCVLEYEGLRDAGRELSLCVIDGDRATLTVWDDPSLLEEFLASDIGRQGVTAVGHNWTIDLQEATVAERVAAALGGTVKRPS